MAEKHQRSDNKPRLNKDGYNWGRFKDGLQMTNLKKLANFFKMLCP